MPVIVLVADGARCDAFEGDLSDLPALRQLRDEGGMHVVSSVFPSVTGPAYTPFLVGRFPGPVGVPGIRWYDRERTACGWPDYSRSYVGFQFSRINDDLDAHVPTIFELVPNSVGALSVVTRGLAPSRRHGTLTPRSALRVAVTHFSGRPERWLDVDREVLDTIPRRMRDDRPDYVFAALAGVDKASHARGHESSLAREALRIVDATAARLRADAEAGGWWSDTHLWVVSDHGHSAIHSHEDLAGFVAATGVRTMAHPWTMRVAPEAAVMVSGNAMANVYLQLGDCARPWWPRLARRWNSLADALLARESVDLMLLPHSATQCEVRSAARGNALVSRHDDVYRYERTTGDPLGHGADLSGTANETYDAFCSGDYPDALVQILNLASSSRAGDVILSATPGWDFRARYEPIPHRSAHGALHRDHMLVPLLMNRPPARRPRRTTDVFASTLAALDIALPRQLDGESFV
ncbi:MAG: alkaline phosphatase family protein [bacterium]